MINDKILQIRVKPYFLESILQLIIDLVIIGLIWSCFIIFSSCKTAILYSSIMTVIYIIVAIFAHYKISIQALIDISQKSYITENLKIVDLKSEFTFAGDRLGQSNIRFFYPKDMQVDRCNIIVIGKDEKENKLRSVISQKRFQSIVDLYLFNYEISDCKITYLKRSKIILKIELISSLNNFTNREIKEIQHLSEIINNEI